MKPNPGSDEAIEAGCRCPVLDNRCGQGAYWGGFPSFWINDKCPIHGGLNRLEDEHRPCPECGADMVGTCEVCG